MKEVQIIKDHYHSYTPSEISKAYGLDSPLIALKSLILKEAPLFYYSKSILAAHGNWRDIPDELKNHFKKVSIQSHKEGFDFAVELEGGYTRLNTETLKEDFILSRLRKIPTSNTLALMPKIHGITLRAAPTNPIELDQVQVFGMDLDHYLGNPIIYKIVKEIEEEEEEKKQNTYYEYERWINLDVWRVAKDFSYITPTNEVKIHLTGLKKEIFHLAFKLHHERDTKPFRSGEIMNSLSRNHKYKGLGDFLGKNKDIAQFFKKINDRGYYRLIIPIFPDYLITSNH